MRWRDRTPAAGAGIPILAIEGIGPTFTLKLKAKGIDTSEQLVAADAEQLATKTGIPVARIRSWQDMAELIRLKGVGPQFAEVLVRCDINSIFELAQQEREPLAAKIQSYLDGLEQTVVGVAVTPKVAGNWIKAARKLKPRRADPGAAALKRELGATRKEDKDDEESPAEPVDGAELAVEAQHEAERGFMQRFARKTKPSVEVNRTKTTDEKPAGRRFLFKRRTEQAATPTPDDEAVKKSARAERGARKDGPATVQSDGAAVQSVQCAQCNHVFAAPAAAAEASCPNCKSLLGLAGQRPAAAREAAAAQTTKADKRAEKAAAIVAARNAKQAKADAALAATAKETEAESAPGGKRGILRFGRKDATTIISDGDEVDDGVKAGLLARLRRKQAAGASPAVAESSVAPKSARAAMPKPDPQPESSRKGLLRFGRKTEVVDAAAEANETAPQEKPASRFKLPAFGRTKTVTDAGDDAEPLEPSSPLASGRRSKIEPTGGAQKKSRFALPFGRRIDVVDEASQQRKPGKPLKEFSATKVSKGRQEPKAKVVKAGPARGWLPFGKKAGAVSQADKGMSPKEVAASQAREVKQARKLEKKAAKEAHKAAKAAAKATAARAKAKHGTADNTAKPEAKVKAGGAGKAAPAPAAGLGPRAIARIEKRERRDAQRREREMARRRERDAKIAGKSTSLWEQSISHPISSPYDGSVWEQSEQARHEKWNATKGKAERKAAASEKVRLIDGRSPFSRLDADKHVHDAPRLPDGRSPFSKLPEDLHAPHLKPRLPDGRSPFEKLPEDEHAAKVKPRLPGGVSPFAKLPEDDRGDQGRVYAFGHRPGREYTTPGGFHVTEALVPVTAPHSDEKPTDLRTLRREEKARQKEQREAAEEKRKADVAKAKEEAKRARKAAKTDATPSAAATPGGKDIFGRFGRKKPAIAADAVAESPAVVAKAPKPEPAVEKPAKIGLLSRFGRKAKAEKHATTPKVSKDGGARKGAKQGKATKAEAVANDTADAKPRSKVGLLARLQRKQKTPETPPAGAPALSKRDVKRQEKEAAKLAKIDAKKKAKEEAAAAKLAKSAAKKLAKKPDAADKAAKPETVETVEIVKGAKRGKKAEPLRGTDETPLPSKPTKGLFGRFKSRKVEIADEPAQAAAEVVVATPKAKGKRGQTVEVAATTSVEAPVEAATEPKKGFLGRFTKAKPDTARDEAEKKAFLSRFRKEKTQDADAKPVETDLSRAAKKDLERADKQKAKDEERRAAELRDTAAKAAADEAERESLKVSRDESEGERRREEKERSRREQDERKAQIAAETETARRAKDDAKQAARDAKELARQEATRVAELAKQQRREALAREDAAAEAEARRRDEDEARAIALAADERAKRLANLSRAAAPEGWQPPDTPVAPATPARAPTSAPAPAVPVTAPRPTPPGVAPVQPAQRPTSGKLVERIAARAPATPGFDAAKIDALLRLHDARAKKGK